MSNHRTDVIATNAGRWYARCSCKARSPWLVSENEADDWVYHHEREVQRVRAHLNGRNPSLRDQYGYYRQMQNDPDLPEQERELWRVLADGLEHRVGVADHTQSMFEESR